MPKKELNKSFPIFKTFKKGNDDYLYSVEDTEKVYALIGSNFFSAYADDRLYDTILSSYRHEPVARLLFKIALSDLTQRRNAHTRWNMIYVVSGYARQHRQWVSKEQEDCTLKMIDRMNSILI